jgi:tetrahydromethanopterin S-methyltransferase subunit G
MDGEKMQKQVDHIEEVANTLAKSSTEHFNKIDERFSHVEEMIDTLARAVKDGFELTATKAEMTTGFELTATKVEMAKGFEGVNSRLEGINRRIDDEVDQRIELSLRVEKVEAKVFPELQRQ